jgi:hypothetical protein
MSLLEVTVHALLGLGRKPVRDVVWSVQPTDLSETKDPERHEART